MELADETITHEATPIGYKTDASHPKGGRDEGNFVANAASQEIGSSTQALIMVGIVPTGLRGHRRRESAAQGRGASRQSRVQDNSCASRYTAAKPPKASRHVVHGELLMRKSANGPLSAITNNIHPTFNQTQWSSDSLS